jgi:hypothetical protein
MPPRKIEIPTEAEVEDKTVRNGPITILPVEATVLKADDPVDDAHNDEQGEIVPHLVRVRIIRRFTLNRDDHTAQTFDPKESNCGMPGFYDVPLKDAEHPYLQAFTDHPPPVEISAGTLLFAEHQQRELRLRNIESAIKKQRENEAIAESRRQQFADLRDRMGGDESGLEDARIQG